MTSTSWPALGQGRASGHSGTVRVVEGERKQRCVILDFLSYKHFHEVANESLGCGVGSKHRSYLKVTPRRSGIKTPPIAFSPILEMRYPRVHIILDNLLRKFC